MCGAAYLRRPFHFCCSVMLLPWHQSKMVMPKAGVKMVGRALGMGAPTCFTFHPAVGALVAGDWDPINSHVIWGVWMGLILKGTPMPRGFKTTIIVGWISGEPSFKTSHLTRDGSQNVAVCLKKKQQRQKNLNLPSLKLTAKAPENWWLEC